jgi:hypothetical protein
LYNFIPPLKGAEAVDDSVPSFSEKVGRDP